MNTNNNNNEEEEENTNNQLSSSSTTPLFLQRMTNAALSNPHKSLTFSLLITLCGAILGPFLDSYHSTFGVLQYDDPIVFITLPFLGGTVAHPALTTAWWVPGLFGLAGFIIGWLYIALDAAMLTPPSSSSSSLLLPENTASAAATRPSPPRILLGISFFTFQYYLSGLLYSQGTYDRSFICVIMSILSGLGYGAFDASVSGFITSLATALGGPLIEVGLISTLNTGEGGYHYTDLGETGFFPLWIVPVYFLGGPAVGNLARGIWNALDDDDDDNNDPNKSTSLTNNNQQQQRKERNHCTECNDSRAVGCPNCDAQGYYITYNQRVKCNCCKGRGLVICRSCFAEYDDGPNDLENIRDIMSKLPD